MFEKIIMKKQNTPVRQSEKKNQQNTNLLIPRPVLLRRSLRLARVLRAQTLQDFSCELLLAVLDSNIRSGQLEAFVSQHDPHLIPRWNCIRSTLFKFGRRVRVRLAIFCSPPRQQLLTNLAQRARKTHRLTRPWMNTSRWWVQAQAQA